ncbi:hypothetical protein [Saccharopolyspora shandongensis]|uniref:hypothetical protein n=1 Tax=Saccharopolyspora shandongensis TaxID=418495 RepID=UPI0033E7F5B1
MTGQVQPVYGARNAGAVPPVPMLIAVGNSTALTEIPSTNAQTRRSRPRERRITRKITQRQQRIVPAHAD